MSGGGGEWNEGWMGVHFLVIRILPLYNPYIFMILLRFGSTFCLLVGLFDGY